MHYLLFAIYPPMKFQMSSMTTLRVIPGHRFTDGRIDERTMGKLKVPSDEIGRGNKDVG